MLFTWIRTCTWPIPRQHNGQERQPTSSQPWDQSRSTSWTFYYWRIVRRRTPRIDLTLFFQRRNLLLRGHCFDIHHTSFHMNFSSRKNPQTPAHLRFALWISGSIRASGSQCWGNTISSFEGYDSGEGAGCSRPCSSGPVRPSSSQRTWAPSGWWWSTVWCIARTQPGSGFASRACSGSSGPISKWIWICSRSGGLLGSELVTASSAVFAIARSVLLGHRRHCLATAQRARDSPRLELGRLAEQLRHWPSQEAILAVFPNCGPQ
jgi:hypothetical protein